MLESAIACAHNYKLQRRKGTIQEGPTYYIRSICIQRYANNAISKKFHDNRH